jgi:hypothetical protein
MQKAMAHNKDMQNLNGPTSLNHNNSNAEWFELHNNSSRDLNHQQENGNSNYGNPSGRGQGMH